ncbi:MAG: TRAP transporter small permease subunit, partial [Lachnospiraceae bacterium]|nr:TRAP transporter small permease subunit [Lachnospiraceae bacterium]
MSTKIFSVIKTCCFILAGLSLTIMFSLVTAEIINRSVFDNSFLIVDEVIGYLMLVIVFLGGILAFDDGKFIRITIFYGKLKKGLAKKIVDCTFYLVFIIYNGALLYYNYISAHSDFVFGTVSGTLLAMPFWIPKSMICLGLILLEIYLICRFVDIL